MKLPKYQVYIRNDCPLPFVEPWGFGPTNIAKPPFKWKLIFAANLGEKCAWGYLANDLYKIGKNIDEHLSKPKNLIIFKQRAKITETLNLKFAEKTLQLNTEQLALKNLNSLLKEWYKAHNLFTSRFMPIDATDETLEQDIRETSQKEKLNLNLNDLACLLTPNALTYVQREHKDFCKLVKLYFKNSKSPAFKKAVLNHEKKWWWTVMGWGQHKPLNKKVILKNLKQTKNVKELLAKQKSEETARKNVLNKKYYLLKKIKGKTRRLLNAFEVLAEMHDTRKEIQMKMMTAGFALTKAILKKIKIPGKYCRFILIEEYLKLTNGQKLSIAELENRIKAYWCEFREKGKINICSGKKALRKIKQSRIDEIDEKNKNNTIFGVVASPGFAKGKVRVGLEASILNKTIKPGEILITSQTTPEFAPAMKKCAAIITDEGGITSHAAIVSRELGIPCIIGTKIATRIFQNGDLVEVNADKGIIKKL